MFNLYYIERKSFTVTDGYKNCQGEIILKRLFDFICSLVMIIILLPLFFLIGLSIKIEDKGPMFFKQDRLGKEGKIFKIYKFRTMIVNAEKVGTGLSTFEGDPRVTKIGRFLRKTSLDEIPQLINILKGD